jgi:hypothetical protein
MKATGRVQTIGGTHFVDRTSLLGLFRACCLLLVQCKMIFPQRVSLLILRESRHESTTNYADLFEIFGERSSQLTQRVLGQNVYYTHTCCF